MAARLGITQQAIDDTLYDAFGQRLVSTMYMPLNQYHVVMEADPQFRQDPAALRHIYIGGTQKAEVPLSEISKCVDHQHGAGRNSLRLLPLGHDLFQSRPRRVAGGSGR